MRSWRVVLAPKQHDVGKGERFAVRNGQERAGASHRIKAPRGPAMKPQLRWPPRPEHLDIPPKHAPRMSGAKRLHRRLLGGKACGKMGCRIPPPRGVGNLSRRENSLQETIAKPLNRLRYSIDIGSIEANADDIHWGPGLKSQGSVA